MFARSDTRFGHAINSAGVITFIGNELAIALRLLRPDVTIERYTDVTLTRDVA